jgi:hypothetical protein
MTYTLTVDFKGGRYTLTWDHGEVSSDNDAFLLFVTATAKGLEGRAIGPVMGPYTRINHLADPLSTVCLVRELGEIVDTTGELPEAPSVPEGAMI